MKLITELKEKPVEGDMLIFNGDKWILIRKSQFLFEIETTLSNINEDISRINETLKKVDEKLASHHNILQQLTESEEE